MPGILDAVGNQGDILEGMFKAAKREAKEIDAAGLLADCKDLDAQLRKAYEPFRECLQRAIDGMDILLTKKLVP